MKRALLFVYGTLREGMNTPEARLLMNKSRPLGAAILEGARLFDLGEYPGAVRADDPSEEVSGQLVEIAPAESDHVLALLDEYEEYRPAAAERSLFIRERAKVRCGDKAVDAWVYWYNGPMHAARAVRGGRYTRRGRIAAGTKR
jgi:gamma-glutamylcyclotransferase (GGCT)/AIG2-like uncharacterized protein YtfP